MANLRSAIRDIRKSRRRAERNQSVRSAIKTYMKKSRTAIDGGAEEVGQVVSQTSSILDKAAKRGIIHPNAANRRKARLAKLLKEQNAAAQAQTA